MRKVCLICGLLLGTNFAAMARQPPKKEVKPDPQFSVLVYDYASLPSWLLGRALDHAKFILGDAGVALAVVVCTENKPPAVCHQAFSPLSAALRFVPHAAPGPYFHSLGYTSKPYITVNLPRVEEAAVRTGVPINRILGCVVAHELGHVLLGPDSHSPAGIMTGLWTNEVLEQIGETFIGFQPFQKKLIREGLLSQQRQTASAGTASIAMSRR